MATTRRLTAFAALAALAVTAGATIGKTTSSFSSSTSTPVNTFSAAASFGGDCPNTTPAMAMMTGFESGYTVSNVGSRSTFFTPGAGFAGTVTIDSVVVRNGTYSANVAATGAAAYRSFLGLSFNAMTAHFAVRLAALPTTDVEQLFSLGGQGTTYGALVGYRYNSGTPKLAVQMRNGSGVLSTAALSTTTVAAGQWYVVDMLYDATGTTHTTAWKVDGVSQAGASQAAPGSVGVNNARMGTTVAATYSANFDDVLVSTSGADYPFPDAAVRRLVPNGQGTNNLGTSITNETGGTADAGSWWQKLDETPAGSTDYVTQNALDTAAYAEFTFQDTTDTCILAVAGTLFATAAGVTKKALSEFRVIDGATTRSVWISGTDTGTAGTINGMGAFMPPVGATWTTAELNGLVGRVGFTNTFPNGAAPSRWDGLALEYLTLP